MTPMTEKIESKDAIAHRKSQFGLFFKFPVINKVLNA